MPEMARKQGAFLHPEVDAAETCEFGVNGVPIVRIIDGILLQFNITNFCNMLTYNCIRHGM